LLWQKENEPFFKNYIPKSKIHLANPVILHMYVKHICKSVFNVGFGLEDFSIVCRGAMPHWLPLPVTGAGLPDGFFSNQKSQFGKILGGLRLEKVDTYIF
jgi:hypothetical protein